MKLIKEEKISKNLNSPSRYDFSVAGIGLYLIKVAARAKGEKQISHINSDDDDLRVEIDGRKFPKLENNQVYLGAPASFSGGQLHDLFKSVYFFVYLSDNRHSLALVPDGSPFVDSFSIWFIGDQLSHVDFGLNDRAEDGDRRPWLTFALVDLPLVNFVAESKTERRFPDSDDVKLIIDGEIKRNYRNGFRKLWFWVGAILKGQAQLNIFQTGLASGLHYVEFWADRMPTLLNINFDFGQDTKRIPTVYDPKWNGNYLFRSRH